MAVEQPKQPSAPRGLLARGRRFWRETVAIYVLTDAERQVLHEVCRLLDDLDRLHTTVVDDGVTVTGSQGQPVLHPALTEVRHARALLAKLVSQLDLPDPTVSGLPGPGTSKASKAAETRWRPHNAAKEG